MLNIKLIRERREAMGLNQEQAAKAARLGTRTHWNRIERGQRQNLELATLLRIARLLKCSAAELIVEPPSEPRLVPAPCTRPAGARKPLKDKGKSTRRRKD